MFHLICCLWEAGLGSRLLPVYRACKAYLSCKYAKRNIGFITSIALLEVYPSEVKFTLKNFNWEKGFRRLWRAYACIVICGTILSKYVEYFSFHSLDSENRFTPLADLIGTWDPEFWLLLLLMLFVPVVLSKAIQ
jgi:hypothetical protein